MAKFSALCPCCSGKIYQHCCEPYHRTLSAPDALALMRSRYSAYALALADYIMDTTHPDCSNFEPERAPWKTSILHFCKHTHFKKLEIIEFTPGEATAYVTFKAHLRQAGKPLILFEKSRFEKVDGRWLYREAELSHT